MHVFLYTSSPDTQYKDSVRTVQ